MLQNFHNNLIKGLFGCVFKETKSAFNTQKKLFEEKGICLVKKLKTLLMVQKTQKLLKCTFDKKFHVLFLKHALSWQLHVLYYANMPFSIGPLYNLVCFFTSKHLKMSHV